MAKGPDGSVKINKYFLAGGAGLAPDGEGTEDFPTLVRVVRAIADDLEALKPATISASAATASGTAVVAPFAGVSSTPVGAADITAMTAPAASTSGATSSADVATSNATPVEIASTGGANLTATQASQTYYWIIGHAPCAGTITGIYFTGFDIPNYDATTITVYKNDGAEKEISAADINIDADGGVLTGAGIGTSLTLTSTTANLTVAKGESLYYKMVTTINEVVAVDQGGFICTIMVQPSSTLISLQNEIKTTVNNMRADIEGAGKIREKLENLVTWNIDADARMGEAVTLANETKADFNLLRADLEQTDEIRTRVTELITFCGDLKTKYDLLVTLVNEMRTDAIAETAQTLKTQKV